MHSGLSEWVSAQRKYYKHLIGGKPSPLTLEHAMKLNEVGLPLICNRERPVEADKGYKAISKGSKTVYWENMFAELQNFREDNGSSNVPACRPFTKLRGFVVRQKLEYKKIMEGKPSSLTAEQTTRLNDIGF